MRSDAFVVMGDGATRAYKSVEAGLVQLCVGREAATTRRMFGDGRTDGDGDGGWAAWAGGER